MPLTLLEPTASAANSEEIRVVEPDYRPAHFTAPGLATTETVTIQKKAADGTWLDCYAEGSVQQITATNSGITAYGPGVYRGAKSTTAAAVGVEVSTDKNP
jgi:hypothetical protein